MSNLYLCIHLRCFFYIFCYFPRYLLFHVGHLIRKLQKSLLCITKLVANALVLPRNQIELLLDLLDLLHNCLFLQLQLFMFLIRLQLFCLYLLFIFYYCLQHSIDGLFVHFAFILHIFHPLSISEKEFLEPLDFFIELRKPEY